MHDEELAGEFRLLDLLFDLAKVAVHARSDIGIGNHGRCALELAVLLRQVGRRRNEYAGKALLQIGLDRLLVRRIAVRVQEQHRHSFNFQVFEPVGDLFHLVHVQGLVHRAVGEQTFAHLKAQVALYQGRVLAVAQVE